MSLSDRTTKAVATLAGMYPLSLIVGIAVVPSPSMAVRLGMMIAASPGLLRVGAATATQRRWIAVLVAYLAAITVSALASLDHAVAFADLQRQLFLIAVAIALSLALLDARARSAFALGSAAVAVSVALVILPLYGRFAGIPLIGPWQDTFKVFASDLDVPLNALSFVGLLAVLVAMPYLRRRPAILVAVVVPVAVAIVVSGSRTTVVSLIAAVPITAVGLLIHRRPIVPTWIIYGVIAVTAAWAMLTFADHLGRLAISPELNDLTTGRSPLWNAAWSKFLDRPLFGWGGGSFLTDLGQFLPGAGFYRAEDVRALATTGGAHNALLNVLAERGLFAAAAAGVVAFFLLNLAIRLYRCRDQFTGLDRGLAGLAPFVVILILVRSLGEMPGWFGYADSMVDFLAYGTAALFVALGSTLDADAPPPDQTSATAILPPAKILQYTHAVGSGAGRYVAGLSRALARERATVTLLCPRDFEYGGNLPDAGVLLVHGPPSLASARSRPGKLWYAVAQCAAGGLIARRRTERAGVVHINFIGLPLLGAVVIAYLRLSGRIVVLTVHDVTPHRLLMGRRMESVERAILGLLYRTPAHLVVHYAGAAAELRDHFAVSRKRITVIPHGADVLDDVAPPKRPVAEPTMRLALLGSIRENKGVDLAIVAVQALRRGGLAVELTIAGHAAASEAAYWRSCQAAIRASPGGFHTVSRYLTDTEMRALLLDADAILLPYRAFAAQSGVAIDALAAGRAIIATGAGGIDELFRSADCGVRISEPTEAAVARAVEQAIRLGRPHMARMGAAGATYVRQQLSWEAVANAHLELYAKLTSSQ